VAGAFSASAMVSTSAPTSSSAMGLSSSTTISPPASISVYLPNRAPHGRLHPLDPVHLQELLDASGHRAEIPDLLGHLLECVNDRRNVLDLCMGDLLEISPQLLDLRQDVLEDPDGGIKTLPGLLPTPPDGPAVSTSSSSLSAATSVTLHLIPDTGCLSILQMVCFPQHFWQENPRPGPFNHLQGYTNPISLRINHKKLSYSQLPCYSTRRRFSPAAPRTPVPPPLTSSTPPRP
jgi:hypothetical protein